MSKIKLSIIFAVYQSYEAVRRTLLSLEKMELPDDIEIIIVDDGSDPPLSGIYKNTRFVYTNDKRPWTQGLARNRGVKESLGDYILMTDIDHILTKESIMFSYNFGGDKIIFPRYYGVLDEQGELCTDEKTLEEYGAILGTKRGHYCSYHGNTFCMKKSTFEKIGGYDEFACLYGHHAVSRRGEDSFLNSKWNRHAREEKIEIVVGPGIHIYPVGRFNKNYDLNPKGLFHNLSYEAVPQPEKK